MITYDFLTSLCTRSADAVIAQSGLRHSALVPHLRDLLGAAPGEPGSFLADPVLEGAFGWKAARERMGELEGLLDPELIAALDASGPVDPERGERYRFGREWRPHAHQLDAWRTLLGEEPRSVLVSSGTGSGKTECFLIPILEDLLRRRRAEGRLRGVRALMLYPLNALISSQRDRLHDWTAPFGDGLRFSLYNGGTPEQVESAKTRARPNEVLDRTTLRADTPPILVTNITMLEYMLIRGIDSPILAQSRGKLRYVILDEAHSYVGSQAAELALLLRRVLDAFEVRPEDVRFVATSATLGDSVDVDTRLRRFLADISGAGLDRVRVIKGERDTTLPTPTTENEPEAADALDRLFDDARALALRKALATKPALLLREAARTALGPGASARDALALAEAAAHARRGDARLMPIRLHLVHRAQAGLWACPNPSCSGRAGTALDDPSWPWGAVSALERERCGHCATPLFEIEACAECGAPHLLAEETTDSRLRAPVLQAVEDEFAQGTESADEADDSPVVLAAGPLLRHLHPVRTAPGAWDAPFDPASGRLVDRLDAGAIILRLGTRDACAACASVGRPEGFKRARFGAPFLLGGVLPQMLEHVAERGSAAASDGRQLITFSDSRQGTARFSARLQQESERNLVRAVLYHAVQENRASEADRRVMDEKRRTIAMLAAHPAMAEMREAQQRELADLESRAGASLPWDEAVTALVEEPDFERLREEVWQYRDEKFAQPRILARILMMRELLRRPRRANSAETLGLVQLRLPCVDKLEERHVPAAFARRGGSLEDWKAFLTCVETLSLRGRSAVHVAREDLRWIGMTLTPRVVLAPGTPRDPDDRRYAWPNVASPQARRSAVVKLLTAGLRLDLDRPDHADDAQSCLDAAFTALAPALREEAGGWQLDLGRTEVARVTEARLCPITNQILATTFRKLTLWQPQGLGVVTEECPAIRMPRLESIRPRTPDARAAVDAWLQKDAEVEALRGRSVWRDLHDRVARFSPVILAAEHSAQQPGWKLRWFEKRFKAGRLNVLSCSTTMEMGVDIGGLRAVVNTNVPPSPASYRQRVGRAGRRREALALALTFARDEPFGWTTYADPMSPLVAGIRPPAVYLRSPILVQRHVNAMLLSRFLARDGVGELHALQAGLFFGGDVEGKRLPSSAAARFAAWCRSADGLGDAIEDALARLVAGSCLEGIAALPIRAAEAMDEASDAWRREWEALARDLPKASGAARTRLRHQLARACGAFVLGELANRGFLPSYGFPTDVVSFLVPDRQDLRRSASEPADGNGFRRLDAPSRSLDLAIRDYAPGAEVVLDGLVYRSAGVTLNWKRPLGADERAPQSIRVAWRCRTCDAAGDAPSDPAQCSECASEDLVRIEYLRPAGFAFDEADTRHAAHTDVTRLSFVEPTPPFVSASGGAWLALPHPELGRMRVREGGTILYRADGPARAGFAVCLHCGRAAAETARPQPLAPPPPLPRELVDHLPLRGPRRDGPCTGSALPFGVKRHLTLGHSARTDVFELQLAALADRAHESAAVAIAVAMREALARRLGVESGEIGYAVSRRRYAVDREGWALLLYDTAPGGAGLAPQASELVAELLDEARRVLDCPDESCRTGCPACVLTSDSRFDAERMDRRLGLAVLDGSVRPLLRVPDRLCVFPQTYSEPRSAAEAVRAGMGAGPLTLYFDGDPVDWDPGAWAGRRLLDRALAAGIEVRLAAPKAALSSLTLAQRIALRALASIDRVSVHSLDGPARRGGLSLLAAAGAEEKALLWAVPGARAAQLGPDWGATVEGPIVRGEDRAPRLSPALDPAGLEPPLGTDARRVEIASELDGPVGRFAIAFWSILEAAMPEAAILRRRGSAASISYSDRYLVTPLAVRLMAEVVSKAPGAAPGVRVLVRSQNGDRDDDRGATEIAHNWRIAAVREAVMQQLLSRLELQPVVKLAAPRDLPHDRRLDIAWGDGSRLSVSLDQGFGFWFAAHRSEFDFTARPPEQARHLLASDFTVRGGRNAKTPITIGPVVIGSV